MTTSEPPLLLTPREAAHHLRCSVAQVYALISRNELVHVRVGQRIRIPRLLIEAAIEAAIMGSEPAAGQ